jgi:hypothetical protein
MRSEFGKYFAGMFAKLRRYAPIANAVKAAESWWLICRQSRVYRRYFKFFRAIDTSWQLAMESVSASALAGGPSARPGWVGSAALHLLVVAIALLMWAAQLHTSVQSPSFVPVDLVALTQDTNVLSASPPAPMIEPVAQITPVPTSMLNVQIPSLPQIDTSSEPSPPQAAVSQSALDKQPATASQASRQPESHDPIASSEPLRRLPQDVVPGSSMPLDAHAANRLVQGAGARTSMTADFMALLQSQIEACWTPPVTAPRPEQYAVDFKLSLNLDGSLARAPELAGTSAATAAHDPFVRAAAEAARQAIYSCAPFKLPADRYSQWREIDLFHFDPSALVQR